MFQTAREKLLKTYEKAKADYVANTLPYHSTRAIKFDVVDVDPGPNIAYAVARANQVLTFFDYGVGSPIALGGFSGPATEAETNLASAKSTNGSSDFVIEGVGFGCRGARVVSTDPETSPTDKDVVDALDGINPVFDPAAIIVPAQVQSPFNLENGMFQALLGYLSLEFEWDRSRTEKLGVVDLLPQAGASSYLRANGEPASDNRYRIPEGYIWRRDGQPDSEFIARVRLNAPLVVPVSLSTDAEGALITPSAIYLDVTMRLFGLQLRLPSAN
ncbi:MAG: hypothetical protein HYZ29_23350 [Myxococcales bacterium]|nr:hypothetical protein [Myxococcales bacterium]